MQLSLSFIQNMPQTINQLEHGGNSKKRKKSDESSKVMAKAQWEDGDPKPKCYLRPTYYEKGSL